VASLGSDRRIGAPMSRRIYMHFLSRVSCNINMKRLVFTPYNRATVGCIRLMLYTHDEIYATRTESQ